MSLTSARWLRTRSDEKLSSWRWNLVDPPDGSWMQKKLRAAAGAVPGQCRYGGRERGKRVG